ncbi:MAG: DUF1553 domain-containing protein [Opitutales bacterium]|nr:DUF1553 domain-containing protein [Opitutales bacterium]
MRTFQIQTVYPLSAKIFQIQFLAISLLSLGLSGNVPEVVKFNRDVQPILSSKCFQCHGPSEKSRKAKLRFDQEEVAFAERDGIRAIVAGDLKASELWHRVTSKDADEVMPPPESKKELSATEIAILKKWIEQGAKWEGHWSFVSVTKPELPKVKNANWPKNPIDRFVLAKLEAKGMQPSSEANRRTLIRRLAFDLTGLPPTPEEVRGFLDDKSAGAYEALVDRLLSSDEYAERMSLVWMDAARYGDTSVFHDDGPRTMWPWRDWVLRAYRDNMPFDQFTIEQLAGDLLPEASLDQKIASGFNRNHATTDEGGVIAEEYRVEYVVDRVKTTGNVWMGLTMECAQCHSHKYDPISQEEYYQFYAFYNNNADPGMQTRRGNQAPVVDVVGQDQQKKKAEIEKQHKELAKKLDSRKKDAKALFMQWAEEQFLEVVDKGEKKPLEPGGLVAHLPLDSFEKNLTRDLVREKGENRLHGKAKPVGSAKFGGGLKIEGNGFVEVKNFGDFEWNRPFSYGCWVKAPNGNQNGCILGKMDEGKDYRGYDLWLQGGAPGAHIVNKWQENAVKVVGKKKITAKKWQHIFVTYNGSGSAAGTSVYLNGEKLDHNVEADGLNASIVTEKPLRLGRRFNSSQANGVEIDDVRFYDRELTDAEVKSLSGSDPIGPLLAIAATDRTPDQTKTLFEHYLNSLDKPYKGLIDQRRKLDTQLAGLKKTKITSMVMADNAKRRATYLLMRGQYSSPQKDKEIEPDTPVFLPEMSKDLPKNRLGMAKWLMDPAHPLTARVTANRHWQTIFSQGIVDTPSDFGSQGNWPTHPDLLDWLAADLRDNGWNVKRAIKQMIMSATYRQSSVTSSRHKEMDPLNQFLARAPRFRLMGEFVRDNALAVSGLLKKQFGGPGVKPYQPPGLWVEVSLSGGRRFVADKAEKLYRRSMYTYWKRSAPQPALMAFDTPSREKCVLKRQRTNTPMQALITLNDEQFVEASRVFAERILKSDRTDFKDRLDYAFELATSRPSDDLRRNVLKSTYDEQHALFTKEPERAKQLIAVGDSKPDASIDPVEHATWTLLASMILNLDETLNRE